MNEWSESWGDRLDEWQGMTKEERQTHLENFMMERYTQDDCYDTNADSIKEMIDQKIGEISYVFDIDDSAAQFGGGKCKKNKKTRKTKKKHISVKGKRKQKKKKLKIY